jgi:5-methylcytosine-specific restriction enzyme subunit McrC
VTHRSVSEWGELPVSAKGCTNGFSSKEAEALVAAARDHPLGGDKGAGILSDHRHYLKARQMVGVISAPGCSLEILRKVDPDAPAQDAPTVRRQLVALLDLALDLGIGEGAVLAMEHQAESLLEILIRQFADRLLAETRRGLPRQYVGCDDDLPVLRGRLDVARQFTIHAVRPDRLACRFDVLSSDIPLMQIMAASVVLLRSQTRAPATQRLLDELRFAFADISLLPLSALPWDKVQIDRTSRRWESLFRLARLLVRREWQSTRHQSNSHDGITLLFPMEKLFEDAVAALLRRALASASWARGIEVVAQGGARKCLGDWNEDTVAEGRHFATFPDIQLKRGREVLAIIDTKWKRLATNPLDAKRGVSQSDVYQMMAYARLYHCDRLMLLYPDVPGAGANQAHRYGIHGGSEMLAMGRVDLSAPANLAAQSLRDTARQLLAGCQVPFRQVI